MLSVFLFSLATLLYSYFFFFSSRRRHTRSTRDWSSDVCFPICLLTMVALIILLLLDLRLGEAVPTSFVDEFTNMVNKRQFKQAYDLCKGDSSFLARVLRSEERRVGKGCGGRWEAEVEDKRGRER